MAHGHVSFIDDGCCNNGAVDVQGLYAGANGAGNRGTVFPVGGGGTREEIPGEGGRDGVAVSSGKIASVGIRLSGHRPGGFQARARGCGTQFRR